MPAQYAQGSTVRYVPVQPAMGGVVETGGDGREMTGGVCVVITVQPDNATSKQAKALPMRIRLDESKTGIFMARPFQERQGDCMKVRFAWHSCAGLDMKRPGTARNWLEVTARSGR